MAGYFSFPCSCGTVHVLVPVTSLPAASVAKSLTLVTPAAATPNDADAPWTLERAPFA